MTLHIKKDERCQQSLDHDILRLQVESVAPFHLENSFQGQASKSISWRKHLQVAHKEVAHTRLTSSTPTISWQPRRPPQAGLDDLHCTDMQAHIRDPGARRTVETWLCLQSLEQFSALPSPRIQDPHSTISRPDIPHSTSTIGGLQKLQTEEVVCQFLTLPHITCPVPAAPAPPPRSLRTIAG